MSTVALTFRQLNFENRIFWRNPAAAFFTFVFPLMFLFIFTSVFGNDPIELTSGETIQSSTYYVGTIAAFSLITACYTNVAMGLSFARDQGVLKRVKGAPLPAPAYLIGRIAHAILIAVLLVAIVTVFGALFYDIEVPTNTLPGLVATLAIGSASFAALAFAITAVIPNAEAAPAIVNFSILPLLFLSGVFFPVPDWMATFSSFFPVKPLLDAVADAFNPLTTGAGFAWADLGVVALWGVAGVALAIRFFSWEPRR
ncbi:MAG: ABC transporter permease [Actinomycetota bacterium]